MLESPAPDKRIKPSQRASFPHEACGGDESRPEEIDIPSVLVP